MEDFPPHSCHLLVVTTAVGAKQFFALNCDKLSIMAPFPIAILSARDVDPDTISDLSISSLELDRRSSPYNLPSYLSNLSLEERERLNNLEVTKLSKRASMPSSPLIFSPHEAGNLLRARDPAPSTKFRHGAGTIRPDAINNKGVFAFFGLLSASLVFASIWFFFWAKNGGFVWRKGDWEDYKSTVLRRKGVDGKTLSNATKSTELGGGSVVGSMESYEAESNVSVAAEQQRAKKVKGKKARAGRDEDVRAYRHEKPAKVGGLNRQPDGSYHDYSNTEPSEISHSYNPPQRDNLKDNRRNARLPSYTVGSEETFSVVSDDRRPLRSSPHHNRHNYHDSPTHTPTHNRSRQSSPRKHRVASYRPASDRYTDPIDFESRYSASEAETGITGTDGTGTKSYFHPIPELSAGRAGGGPVVEKSVNGFRRAGAGGRARRDSLSDSEGETETVRS